MTPEEERWHLFRWKRWAYITSTDGACPLKTSTSTPPRLRHRRRRRRRRRHCRSMTPHGSSPSAKSSIDQARQYEASSHWAAQSIYHRSHPRLLEMDRHKWRALYHALTRTGHDVRLYLDVVRSLENRARACYEASLSISTDDFVKCLLLDSIFVLEIFRGVAKKKFPADYDPYDPIFSVGCAIYSLLPDMLLLENQLPLFILDIILALQLGHRLPRQGLVARLALHFFHPLRLTDEPFTSSDLFHGGSSRKPLHCLDLFRSSLLFPDEKPPPSQPDARPAANISQLQLIHCVADLRNAGIKFRRKKSDRFWDITFKNGVLKIPHLCIQSSTKSLLLNLIAFELCNLKCNNYITSYVIFMDNLISSEADVGYLHDKGIIKHWLGNDREVADLFNRLSKGVMLDITDCYLSELSVEVNNYYNQRWNVWRATLSHKYFSNPWNIISLVAAIVLLLLTFLQTLYAIYDHYKPK